MEEFRDAHGSTGQIKDGAFVAYGSQKEADKAVVSGSPESGDAKHLELQNQYARLEEKLGKLPAALKEAGLDKKTADAVLKALEPEPAK